MSKKKYFYIESYVYSILLEHQLLLYNTFNFKSYTFNLKDPLLFDFAQTIFEKNKTRICNIPKDLLNNSSILNFIDICKSKFLGDIIETDKKPLILNPIPKLNEDIRNNYEDKPSISKNDLKYSLKNFHIFLNTLNPTINNKELIKNGYKQILFPIFSSENRVNIEFSKVINFFSNYDINKIDSIRVYGNIFNDKVYKKYLSVFKGKIIINILYKDIDLNDFEFQELILKYKNLIIIWVDNDIDIDLIRKISRTIKHHKFKFVTEDIDEIINPINTKNLRIEKIEFIPFYNKKNIEFFNENIFIWKNDLLSQKLTEHNIFSKMFINQLFYGNLFLLPNGNIYSNLFLQKTGNIKNDNLEDILKKVWFNEGSKSWFLTREEVIPCKKCIYKFICPPLSNYEFSIGKINLCHYNSKINKWSDPKDIK